MNVVDSSAWLKYLAGTDRAELFAEAIEDTSMGKIIKLDSALALEAARLPLPMADIIIYATALRYNAILWTQDAHFEGIQGVRYFRK